MSDNAGDRFTGSNGKTYELRPDPKGGHLRPFTVKGSNFSAVLAAIVVPIITGVLVAGGRWVWDKITKRAK